MYNCKYRRWDKKYNCCNIMNYVHDCTKIFIYIKQDNCINKKKNRRYVMKKKIFALTIVTMMLLVGFISVEAAKPEDKINNSNGAPSGKHFTLNILGKDWNKGDTWDDYGINPVVKNDNGHRIFVKLDGKTRILLREGDFGVWDADGTDGKAIFALPDPGDVVDDYTAGETVPSNNYYEENQEYRIYIRVLSPRGKANITTEFFDGADWIASEETVELTGGTGKKIFSDVTKELTTISVDLDGDGRLERYKLFDDNFQDWSWLYNNDGLRHVQMRFYEV